jgi:adenosine deaminase
MFGTSLSEEFARCADAFEFNEDILWSLTLNAAKASLIAPRERDNLIQKMSAEFSNLQQTTNAHFPSVHKGL